MCIRSSHCWRATLGGFAVACVLAAGCDSSRQKDFTIEEQLEGSWRRQDGGLEMVFWTIDARRVFRVFRGVTIYEGEWTVEGKDLLMEPAIAKLASGEHMDVKDVPGVSLIPSYQIVSIQPDALHLQVDPEEKGPTETLHRIRYEEQLVGDWRSRDGRSRMKLGQIDTKKKYGILEEAYWSEMYQGEWRIEGKTLHLQRTVAKLANSKEKNVRDIAPLTTYWVVSVQPDVLRLDPGNGQTKTYVKAATTQNKLSP